MSSEDRRLEWDLKYEQGLPSLTEPDPLFIWAYETFAAPSFPKARAALDVAGGLGRHGLWLAMRNWQVTVVDVSEVAMAKLRQTADALNLDIKLFVGDAARYKFEPEGFDLIVLFYHMDRSLFPRIASALKTGGVLISKMSLRWSTSEEPVAPRNDLLYRGELPSLLPGISVLHHEERPVRDRGVVEFVGKSERST
jgi:SAM-dependent methyltransferase